MMENNKTLSNEQINQIINLLNENGINLIEEDCHLVIPESVDILQY